MNEIALKKQSVKKESLRLTFYVLFTLFLADNVLAQKRWTSDDVSAFWDVQKKYIFISAKVYDYAFGPNSEHGYLEECTFKYAGANKIFSKLLEISTEKQNQKNTTMMSFKNKLQNAQIEFLEKVTFPPLGAFWTENERILSVTVRHARNIAMVSFGWHVGKAFRNVRYIRISGKWHCDVPYLSKHFDNIVYDIYITSQSMLKSNTPGINTNVSKNDTAKVFKDSEVIVIKGADPGANIKLYSTTGAEIKSVISNNNIVKIKLPANQIYYVHIGKSRYKVVL